MKAEADKRRMRSEKGWKRVSRRDASSVRLRTGRKIYAQNIKDRIFIGQSDGCSPLLAEQLK